jgi:hypothetical protein
MSHRATSKSWKGKPLRGDPRPVPFFRNLTSAEAQRVLGGLIPEAMEDKWFIFEQDDIVPFCPSWTGYTLYQVAHSQDNVSFPVPSNVSPEKSAFFKHHVVGHARPSGGQQ